MPTSSFAYLSSTTVPVSQDPDAVTFGKFVSIYDGSGVFTSDISFYEELEVGSPIFQNIELVSYNAPINGLTVSQKNLTTLTLTGTATNVIQGGYFKFLMPDKSIQFLPANTTEEYDALLEWSPPPVKVQEFTHTMQVRILKTPSSSNYIETLTATQEVYWRYEFGLQAFQTALSKGKL